LRFELTLEKQFEEGEECTHENDYSDNHFRSVAAPRTGTEEHWEPNG